MSRRLVWIVGLAAAVAALAGARAATVTPRAPASALAAEHPLVWAHQGASGHAPSNTLESFRLAVQMGADALETDLQMTRDGVIVLSHDETVDRMTNGTGAIADLTLSQLRQLDAGYGFVAPDGTPWRDRGARIPTLDEFLAEFAPLENGRLRFILELKTSDPPMEEPLLAAIHRYGIADRVLVGSFHQAALDTFRRLSEGRIATTGASREMYTMAAFWKTGLGFLWQPAMDAFAVPTASGPLRTDTPDLMRFAHGRGIKVVYWTIDEEAEMRRLLEMGADGLITNFPDRAVTVMREMGLRR